MLGIPEQSGPKPRSRVVLDPDELAAVHAAAFERLYDAHGGDFEPTKHDLDLFDNDWPEVKFTTDNQVRQFAGEIQRFIDDTPRAVSDIERFAPVIDIVQPLIDEREAYGVVAAGLLGELSARLEVFGAGTPSLDSTEGTWRQVLEGNSDGC